MESRLAVTVVDALTSLAQNIALLLSLTLLYGVVRPYSTRLPGSMHPLVAGVPFALIATAAMHTPFVIAPGVIGDARLIPILLAGPFGGPGAALTAAALAAVVRAWIGGAGSAAGVGSILTAGLFSVAVALWWRRRIPRRAAVTFVLLGVALDAIVLAWAVGLPDAALAQQVLSAAAVPIGLFLPFGTLVLGMLLVHERSRVEERERLALTQLLSSARRGRCSGSTPPVTSSTPTPLPAGSPGTPARSSSGARCRSWKRTARRRPGRPSGPPCAPAAARRTAATAGAMAARCRWRRPTTSSPTAAASGSTSSPATSPSAAAWSTSGPKSSHVSRPCACAPRRRAF